uniref:Secreted protein n=1 Tax=Mesocestoides corti TaxID=53468 RepID=A0A5K3EJA0_MESCO
MKHHWKYYLVHILVTFQITRISSKRSVETKGEPDRPNFVFDGTAWVRFIPVPVNPNHAAGVSVHLKTKEPNGLVFWAGDAKISFIVYLLNGSMHF